VKNREQLLHLICIYLVYLVLQAHEEVHLFSDLDNVQIFKASSGKFVWAVDFHTRTISLIAYKSITILTCVVVCRNDGRYDVVPGFRYKAVFLCTDLKMDDVFLLLHHKKRQWNALPSDDAKKKKGKWERAPLW